VAPGIRPSPIGLGPPEGQCVGRLKLNRRRPRRCNETEGAQARPAGLVGDTPDGQQHRRGWAKGCPDRWSVEKPRTKTSPRRRLVTSAVAITGCPCGAGPFAVGRYAHNPKRRGLKPGPAAPPHPGAARNSGLFGERCPRRGPGRRLLAGQRGGPVSPIRGCSSKHSQEAVCSGQALQLSPYRRPATGRGKTAGQRPATAKGPKGQRPGGQGQSRNAGTTG